MNVRHLACRIVQSADEFLHGTPIPNPRWLCTAADISYGVPPGHHGKHRRWHAWWHRWITEGSA